MHFWHAILSTPAPFFSSFSFHISLIIKCFSGGGVCVTWICARLGIIFVLPRFFFLEPIIILGVKPTVVFIYCFLIMPISKWCHAFIIKPDRTKTTKPKPSFSSLSYYIFDMNYYNLFPTPHLANSARLVREEGPHRKKKKQANKVKVGD